MFLWKETAETKKQNKQINKKTQGSWWLTRQEAEKAKIPDQILQNEEELPHPPSTPSQDSLFGAYNSARKQKHKETPQQDSKDYSRGFWRLYHGDRKQLEAVGEEYQGRPLAKWPSPVSCSRVTQRLTMS